MNQKIIDKAVNHPPDEKENEKHFQDVKKINEKLIQESKLKKERVNTSTIKTERQIKTTPNQIDTSRLFKKDLNISKKTIESQPPKSKIILRSKSPYIKPDKSKSPLTKLQKK